MIELILLVLGLLCLAFLSRLIIIEFQVRKKFHYMPAGYMPSVSVIAPCKGIEPGFEENISSLLKQKYRNFEVIFVIDSYKDPCYAFLKKSMTKNSKIIIARKKKFCSGKISAILTGLKHAKNEILVFYDSDALAPPYWLSHLVDPLKDEKIGATTGYRYYIPRKDLTSHLLSSWNNIGFGLMFGKYRFLWGGSTALRRSLFDKLKIEKRLEKALSDDSIMTLAVQQNKLDIKFVPTCVLKTKWYPNFSGLSEFVTRQTFIVKTYFPHLIKYSYILIISSLVATFLGFMLLFTKFYLYSLPFLLILPLLAVRNYINFENYRKMYSEKPSFIYEIFSSIFVYFIYVYTISKAYRTNKIQWKGRVYLVKSPYSIKQVRHI